MKTGKKIAKYPENLYLKGAIAMSGRTVKELAATIGYTRSLVSDVVNGHYKGTNIVPLLRKELGIK